MQVNASHKGNFCLGNAVLISEQAIYPIMKYTETIEKEELKKCAFTTPNKRFTDFELRERNQRLYLAMLMGNNFSSPARIVFNTVDGYKEVCSTIWATTERYILLKGGNVIPLEAIASIELK